MLDKKLNDSVSRSRIFKLNFFKVSYFIVVYFCFFMVYSLSWLYSQHVCLWKHACILTSKIFCRTAVYYVNWVNGVHFGPEVCGIKHVMWLWYPWFSVRWAVLLSPTPSRTVELSNKCQNGTEVTKISRAAVWYYPASVRIMAYVWRQKNKFS